MPKQDFTAPAPRNGLIGHRGIAALAPENTLSSFRLAEKQGIEWIEFDLRLTKDKQLVVFHDDTLERTSNGKGFVHDHTLAMLACLDAGSWFSSQFIGEKIPQFSEILPELIRLKRYLNIELKIPPQATQTHQRRLVETLIETLIQHWPTTVPWPLISSFHWDLLTIARNLLPQAPIGFLQDRMTESLLDHLAVIPNTSLHCNYHYLNETLLIKALKLNIPVLVYTVNQPEIARKLLLMGIYGLFSDNPLHLLKQGVKAPQ